MSLPSGKYGARLSDTTAVDPADPFDATDRSVMPAPSRGTQLSDPPTALVRREGFHELPSGAVVGDNYEIETRLGAGAMGEVYAARHMRLGKRVAIKVIGKRLSEDAAAIERFAMEARALAQIHHPSIVAVEHIGELSDGRAFFVMEFLRGQSLYERLQRGRLPLAEALRVIDQIARGLEAAHAEGIIHRDLKPENTFLVHLPGELPTVKLVDFGLAKLKADRAGLLDIDRRAERTQSGVAIGTPMYMSPEQMRGPDVDHRTDVYALGCVAYELLLGVPPFPHARTAPELFAAHLSEAPPLPRSIWPEIPPQLDLCLFAMLAKDPAHRPTLTQIRSVIAAATAGSASQRAATEIVRPRTPRRHLAIVAIALAAMIGGIAIGVTATKSRPQTPPAIVPSGPSTKLEAIQPTAVTSPPVEDSTAVKEVAPRPVPVVPPSAVPRPSPSKTTPSRPIMDAGVEDAASAAVQKMPEKTIDKPVDKPKPFDPNQTINPFDKKRTKGTP